MTINEIADLADVSKATVSRYLNDGYVSAEKRERIRAVIERTGYSPSTSAQQLRSKKSRCVGVIIPKINSDSIGRMVSGISRTLAGAGYQLLLACTHNDEREELKYLRLFRENNVDGIVLLGTVFTAGHKALLAGLSVPIVILAQDVPGYSCVYADDYGAARSMGAELARTGREFAMIAVTERDDAVGRRRKQGFLDALAEAGKALPAERIATADFTMESGYRACAALLAAHPGIDTLFCVTDTIAAGAMQWLNEHETSVPGGVQVAGVGDSTVGRVTFPPLTTVHFYYETAGKEAAGILLDHIAGNGAPAKHIQLAYEIVRRASTRPA